MNPTASSTVSAKPVPAIRGIAPQIAFNDGLCHHHLANTAYPIGHRSTIWRHRVPATQHAPLLRRDFNGPGPMCLYAHIPFCQTRCSFCEYCVVDRHDPEREDLYQRSLLQELDLHVASLGLEGKPLSGFDIGGGTPSLINPRHIGALVDRVLRTFRTAPGFGMSIETTPRVAALEPDRLVTLRSFGIDRISMGLQMINPRLLQAYDRSLHEAGFNRPAVDAIRRAGFRQFNIDLMYGFARQSPDDFVATLHATIRLQPDVITLYRMRYKGTRIEQESGGVTWERVVLLHELAREHLLAAGYHANPGKNTFTRDASNPGTSAYLTRRVIDGMPYLGIGLGAQTFTGRLLGYNHGAASKKLDAWLASVAAGQLPIQDLYDLPPSEGMAKMLAVSFYFGEIDLDAFRLRFGTDLREAFPLEVEFVLTRGLMALQGTKLRLTEAGAKVFPGVVALFYSNAVKAHLHVCAS